MTPPGGSETVLIVEDDAVLRQLFASVLAPCGYEVLTAAGGNEALAVVHGCGGRVRLVVSDINMPGMNGLELARRLQADADSVKVLLLSGDGEAALADAARLGAAFLEKPMRPSALARQVRELLDAVAGRPAKPSEGA